MKKLFFLASCTLLVTSLISCGNPAKKEANSQSLTGQISIDGSSTVYPITEAVAESLESINQM